MITRKEQAAKFGQGYKVMVTGRHVNITDGMKQHAVDRLSKIDHIDNHIIDVNVTMDIQKLRHHVEISMKVGHTFIFAQAATTDMYASIDQAVDKLDQQLRRYKSRLHNHHKKGYPVKEIPVRVLAPLPDEEIEEVRAAK